MTTFFFIAAVIGGYFGVRLWLKPRIDERPELKLMLGAGASIVAAWAIAKWAGYSAAGWTFGLMFGPVAVVLVWQKAFGDGGGGWGNGDHVRGSQIVPTGVVKRMMSKHESLFSIGEIPFPRKKETEHLLVAGSTGTGKSQIIFRILNAVRGVGERIVCFDINSELLGRYYRADVDHLFNPFDARSVSWSPLSEMRHEADAMRLANSLIPSGQGERDEWVGYAQKMLAAVLLRLWESGVGNNAEIIRLLTLAPTSELEAYVAGLPAQGVFREGSEKMLSGVLSVISTYIDPFQYLDPMAGADAFSVRDWVKQEPGADDSWLFMSVLEGQLPGLRPMVAAMIDTAICQTLELPKNTDRAKSGKPTYALWFILDEVASLRIPLDSLESGVEKIRKVGGRIVCGLQNVAQWRSTYGSNRTQTLLGNLKTWVVLNPGKDSVTAEHLSSSFGMEEIAREQVSEGTSFDPMAMRKTTNSSTSINFSERRVLLASELSKLAELVGYLDIAGDTPPCLVHIPVVPGEPVAEPFVPKARVKKLIEAPASISPTAAEAYVMPTPDEIEAQPEPDYAAAEAYDELPDGIDDGPIPDGFEPGQVIAAAGQRDAGHNLI